MSIDIRGINTHNKGAHLMLLAVVDRLGGDFHLATSPNGSGYDTRARLGLAQTAILNQAPRTSAIVSNVAPRMIAKSFGIVRDRDIRGVVDAAGFAYSDSFSSERSRREALHARRWSRRAVPIVALPQAFGPFKIADRSRWSAAYLQHAKVAFARDDQSYEYLKALLPKLDVRRSPDFTIGLKPAKIEPLTSGPFAALVPNGKVVSHTGVSEDRYAAQLAIAGRTFRSLGIEPIVVVHESGDRKLAQILSDQLGCVVFEHEDPLVLKAVLAAADFAVASRFHALVSGLSQGTPSIAFGWSHKYAALLADFSADEWLFTPDDDMSAMVTRLVSANALAPLLKERSSVLAAQNEDMWNTTRDVLSRRI